MLALILIICISLFDIYTEFIGRPAETPRQPEKEKNTKPEIEAAKTAESTAVTDITAAATDFRIPEKSGNGRPRQLRYSTASGAVLKEDFEEYGRMLTNGTFENRHNHHMIPYKGKNVNIRWLQYNLFQYCLPLEERRFLQSAGDVMDYMDIDAMQKIIKEYFAAHALPAIAA